MKNIGYQFIIVILSLINIFLNFETLEKKDYYNVRLSEGYVNVGLPTNPIKSGYNTNKLPIQSQSVQNSMNVPPVLKEEAYLSAAFDYSLGDARLVGEAGVMKTDIALSINPIEGNELPPLNQGMVNVTGDNSGYRMLPKGIVFRDDINIILPYDSTLLPMGFTPYDIKTYFYHDTYKRWIEIERDSVDENNQLVISKVNHFTDFINAVLKTPEMPETSAYAPTQMNDIKAANPFEGLQIMQPPTANNSGSTNMSYPIEIPAGRQGMQPNLALNYNGTTASSWVGVGWDLSIPTITVETRWGVPRYYQDKESELYLLNGQQLVTKDANGDIEEMPHRTNKWKLRTNNPTGIQFFPRINETFDSIVRHGTNPTNYWWSVTDRNGITSYYGKKHDLDEVDPNAVLADATNNIAHWGLTETRDINGNTVRYYYSIVHSYGIINGTIAGRTIYIDSINYTGFVDSNNVYENGINTVYFQLSDTKLKDVISSCNYGFEQVIDKKLCQVYVQTLDSFYSGVRLRYENTPQSLNKTRLVDLVKTNHICKCHQEGDADTTGLIRTHFDYHDMPSQVFGISKPIQGKDDNIKTFFINDPAYGTTSATALGATKGKSWSVGGTGTIGFGPDICTTTMGAGGNFDYSQSSSEGLLTMIDLNGDGLSDKVFKKNGEIYYRPMLQSSVGNLSFGDSVLLEGLDNILKESSESTSWGLQASILLLSANASWGSSNSLTSVYFSDVNADGLPDLITDEGVLFNTIENGIPTFKNYINIQINEPDTISQNTIITSTSGKCGGIIFDGEVSDSIACHLDLIYIMTIPVQGLNSFFADSIPSSNTEDNYQVYIDDEGKFCDIFLKQIICEPVLKNPDLDLVKVWVAPREGTINIWSTIQMLQESYEPNIESKYANGIRYTIEVCNTINPTNGYFINAPINQTIKSGYITRGNYSYHDTAFSMTVAANTILFFRLQSNGNRTFDNIVWNKEIEYSGSSANGHPYYENSFISNNDYLVTGKHFFVAPKDGSLDYHLNIETDYLYGETIELIVEKIGVDIYTVPLTNNMDSTHINTTELFAGDSVKLFIRGTAPKNHPVWSNIQIRPKYDYYTSDTNITERVIYYPSVNYEQVHHIGPNKLDTVFYGLFGPLYKQWGQFCYNNNYTNGSITDPIEPSTLRKDFSFLTQTQQDFEANIESCPDTVSYEKSVVSASFNSQGKVNPLSLQTRWVDVIPYSYQQTWAGYGNINYLCKDTMSNSRFKTSKTDTIVNDIQIFDHPVPLSLTSNQVKTIRKQSISDNKSKGLNLNLGVSVGGSSSKGNSRVLTDYIDLNGDRYPDILGEVYVQYTNPWGGIGSAQTLQAGVQGIGKDTSNSWGVSFGASYPIVKKMVGYNPVKDKATVEGSGNTSASYSNSKNKTFDSYIDVNGDGLPDKIDEQGRVSLNIGYGFLQKEDYNLKPIREGKSNNLGVSGGVSLGATFDVSQGSISGGTGMNISDNTTERTLMDFNGDGIVDIVYKNGSNMYVKYRNGDGTTSTAQNIGDYQISYGVSSSESANIGINVGFTWGWAKFGVGIQGVPYGKSFSKDKVQLVDIDGDGFLDYITSNDESEIQVRYNQTGMTNLLKTVTNFTGSTIELDYHLTENSYDSPQRSWVLKSVKTNDAYSPVGGNSSYVSYEYRNPNYNRFERISYGYDTVITYQYDSENNNTLYRKTIQGYNNKSFIKKGKKTCETICDATGKVYVETFYDVDIIDANGQSIGDEPCPQLYFPNRVCEVTNYYEGMSTPQITTKKCVTYDSKKNVTEYLNVVDSASSVVEDNLRANISYKTGMPNNMISLVDSIKVYNSDDVLLREKTAEYSTNGKLKKIIQYDGSNQAEIDFEYDQYGNVTKMTFPENVNQQRMWNQYVYDPVVHSYPITVSNALGYQSSAEYNYKWGKPTKTFDVNGQEMQYKYDHIGRLEKIIGPNEIANNAPYTIMMKYFPANYGRWNIFTPSIDTFSYARTFHYMANDPSNPIQTTILCDGLGRVLQTKKDIDSSGVELMVVSGRIWYDSFGRTLKQFHPVTEPLGKDSLFNYSYDLTTQTHTEYDVLDRQTMIALPTGDMSFMEYTFGDDAFGVKRFLTISTDPNGNRVKTFTDPRKLQSTVVADSVIITKFIYSALGELLESIDPEGISTYYFYNNFGQKTSRIHPDAGTDQFYYDLAGNLINRRTQDLINNNITIDYVYNYNQLLEIHYPKNPENNVYYYYGDSNAPNNCIGRIWAIEDASGRQEFSYGRMGEVIGNVRTFALPNESNTYTFAMSFEYDSWNRILGTTYPDGEHVRYWYNKGGQLSKMASNYNNVNYPIIDSVVYNKFEQRTKIFYGNGTKADYTYDILQRLVHLNSTSASGVMQRIDYSFDHVNNIRSIRNGAGVLSNGLGGTYRHEYKYDNIYRLTSSYGNWDNNNNSLGYNLDLTYTMDGRIRSKKQNAITLISGTLSGFSYDNEYLYGSNQPHTVRRINDNQNQTFQDIIWDPNGNLALHYTQRQNNVRRLCWDEENRLMAVGDNRNTSYYVYDNGGERTYKLTGPNTLMNINGNWMNFAYMDNPTLYTSAYLVAGVQGYTKHYYAGSERVSSAIGLGGLERIKYPLHLYTYHKSWEEKSIALNKMMSRTIRGCLGHDFNNKKTLEGLYQMTHASTGTMARYFYHPDHIGSSSWITDGTGQAIQHLHYLPFGEDWVDQRNTSWNAPYTFSGKEKDAETGYGYFGARYYDSGLSIWLSVDQMSDKYPNLSPYNYCANNPVMLVDPDGREIYVCGYLYKNGMLVDEFGKEVPLTPGSFRHKVVTSLNEIANIKNKTGENDKGKDLISSRFNDLMTDGKEHKIVESKYEYDYSSANNDQAGLGIFSGGSSTEVGLTGNGQTTSDGKFFNFTLVLSHELLGHSWDKSVGVDSRTDKTENGILMVDVSAINVQNLVAKEQGIKVKRTLYGSREIPKELLDTYFTKRKK